jgi:hypothetical protein
VSGFVVIRSIGQREKQISRLSGTTGPLPTDTKMVSFKENVRVATNLGKIAKDGLHALVVWAVISAVLVYFFGYPGWIFSQLIGLIFLVVVPSSAPAVRVPDTLITERVNSCRLFLQTMRGVEASAVPGARGVTGSAEQVERSIETAALIDATVGSTATGNRV